MQIKTLRNMLLFAWLSTPSNAISNAPVAPTESLLELKTVAAMRQCSKDAHMVWLQFNMSAAYAGASNVERIRPLQQKMTVAVGKTSFDLGMEFQEIVEQENHSDFIQEIKTAMEAKRKGKPAQDTAVGRALSSLPEKFENNLKTYAGAEAYRNSEAFLNVIKWSDEIHPECKGKPKGSEGALEI